MALGSTQCLTEMSTRDILWGVKAAGALGLQLYHLHMRIVLKYGSLNFLSGPAMGLPCKGKDLYLYMAIICNVTHEFFV
jgi:hypothetical protein